MKYTLNSRTCITLGLLIVLAMPLASNASHEEGHYTSFAEKYDKTYESREAADRIFAQLDEEAKKQNKDSDSGDGSSADDHAADTGSSSSGGGDDTWETVGIVAGAVVVVSVVTYFLWKHFKAPNESADMDVELEDPTAVAYFGDALSVHLSHGIFDAMEHDAYDAASGSIEDLGDVTFSMRYAF